MPAKRASKQAAVLPNEIWLKIFNNIGTSSLLDLTLVCKLWNGLIFNNMADRFQLNIDMDLRKFPEKAIGMVPNRYYRHLCFRSFRLDSLRHQWEIVKCMAPNLNSLKLHLVTLDFQLLEQLLALCTRIKELEIKARYFEYGEEIYNQKQAIPSVESVSIDIENRVSTFNSGSSEMALLPCIPNVKNLTITIHDPLDLVILESLAPRLDILTVTVSCDATDKLFNIHLPELSTLDLRLKHPDQCRLIGEFERTAFLQFLLECKKLRKVMLECEFDVELLSMIFSSLPEVTTLKLYSNLTRQYFSLNGLEKMVNLKTLTLRCLLVYHEIQPIVPMPTMENLSLRESVSQDILIDTLIRFPNLKYLSLPIRRCGKIEVKVIAEHAPRLENLCVIDLMRFTPELIRAITQLECLKTLTIEANVIAQKTFRLLSFIIDLPTLRSLTIKTSSKIPISISRDVASTNQACKLILNGALVLPPVNKQQQPASGAAPVNRRKSTRW